MPNATPPVDALGCVTKPRWLAAPDPDREGVRPGARRHRGVVRDQLVGACEVDRAIRECRGAVDRRDRCRRRRTRERHAVPRQKDRQGHRARVRRHDVAARVVAATTGCDRGTRLRPSNRSSSVGSCTRADTCGPVLIANGALVPRQDQLRAVVGAERVGRRADACRCCSRRRPRRRCSASRDRVRRARHHGAPARRSGDVDVIGLVSPTTTLPPASTVATCGWVENATPPVDELGWVTNTRCVARSTVTSIAMLSIAGERPDRLQRVGRGARQVDAAAREGGDALHEGHGRADDRARDRGADRIRRLTDRQRPSSRSVRHGVVRRIEQRHDRLAASPSHRAGRTAGWVVNAMCVAAPRRCQLNAFPVSAETCRRRAGGTCRRGRCDNRERCLARRVRRGEARAGERARGGLRSRRSTTPLPLLTVVTVLPPDLRRTRALVRT